MELPRGKFALIMADPPWKTTAWSAGGLKQKSPEAHYRTMTFEDIMALDVASIALDDCVLWLWTTWMHLLGETRGTGTGFNPGVSLPGRVMEAWGFRYSTGGAWHKRTVHGKTAFGTGKRLRGACEPFLIGVRGAPKTERRTRNLVEDMVREHSRKPEAAYRAAEELMPNVARLDLFSREPRAGWLSWGDEQLKFATPATPAAGSHAPNRASRLHGSNGAPPPWAPSPQPKRSPRDRKSLSGSATASR